MKAKKEPAIMYRERPMAFKEQPQKTTHCTCWLEHDVPELYQLKSKKKKARKLGVRVRTEFTGLFRIGLDSK